MLDNSFTDSSSRSGKVNKGGLSRNGRRSRVRNQFFCPVCKQVVERDDLVRGFEVSKDEYVQFTLGLALMFS